VGIVSPGQSVNALVRRCLWYVEHGVQAALLLDPADESVLLIRPDRTTTGLHGPDRIDLQDVLPGFHLTVQDLFDSLTIR
jgi:Uma2 family endonuclease